MYNTVTQSVYLYDVDWLTITRNDDDDDVIFTTLPVHMCYKLRSTTAAVWAISLHQCARSADSISDPAGPCSSATETATAGKKYTGDE